MKITYDQSADVLYLTFDETKRRCDYVEEEGVVLRVQPGTKAVASCTIPRFSIQSKNGLAMPFLHGAVTANVAGLRDKKRPA